VGLKSKNILKFYVINTTDEKYDYSWIPIGDPSSFWKCGQCSGTLFPGKRTEILFEYVPEYVQIAESFYMFKLSCDVEQLFLFVGTVTEPRVTFSTSKIDFRSVAVGGVGNTEIVYLQNTEDISFQYSFTRATLSQLEGSTGTIIEINPKSGTIFPRSKIPISMIFLPKDEGRCNFNLLCDIKSKPIKLNINVKGEGYAVHPVIRINDGQNDNNSNMTLLLPSPYLNILDFGAVQINESTMKSISVFNNGHYNFDYVWNLDQSGSTVYLNKGKMSGNLSAGVTAEHSLTFAPLKEMLLESCLLGITIAGKHHYNIAAKGMGIQPAIRFSSTNFDFGACFITSPGGSVLVETLVLKITNNDSVNSMSVECGYLKTRAMWVDCSPVVIFPGVTLDVPLHFAPRETIDYAFSIPFLVNGSVKVKVGVVGKGVNARLDMMNIAQKKISFGVLSTGKSSTVIVPLINKSKKAITLQILDGNTVSTITTSTVAGGVGVGVGGGGGVCGVSLADCCITVLPAGEVIVQPRATLSLEITFFPNKRVGTFSEDLMIRYAGLTRKLLLITGKALGSEHSLDTDSIAFGAVVEHSQIVKTLSLFNSGDLPLSFSWDHNTFGKHFHILPLAGKVIPGSEATFNVSFRPTRLDSDIRQSDMTLSIAGSAPLLLSCTGCCVVRPAESSKILQFNSVVRTTEIKSVKITNPTDRDWLITPALQSDHWKVPREVRVPARGSADVAVSYCPLTMCPRPQAVGPVTVTKGAGALNTISIHYTALPSTALYCIALHCTILHCPALHCTVLLCAAPHYTALPCTTLYFIALHYTILHCPALHYTILHCPAVHCTTLYPHPTIYLL
jgi:hydrocephalus-inducing protein